MLLSFIVVVDLLHLRNATIDGNGTRGRDGVGKLTTTCENLVKDAASGRGIREVILNWRLGGL
jgi:hypothetical protein